MVGLAARAARRLVLVAGDPAWAERWVAGQLGDGALADTLWVAQRAPPGVGATVATAVVRRLGGEYRLLVFDAHQGFHPDAFAAAVGTLRGGGDCVLLVPPLDRWAAFPDPDKGRFAAYPHGVTELPGRFVERLVRLWPSHPATRVVTAQDPGLRLRLAAIEPAAVRLSAAQATCLAAVERVARGHARRPLVITADRGRGKSTVLGLAAARLLRGGLPRVTVIAAHRTAVQTLYRHALGRRPGEPVPVGDVRIGAGQLCFRLPIECLQADDDPGLVIVDEAAAIATAVLAGLLDRSARLVFATTVHGYEGSGRGFAQRFRAILDRRMPQWRALSLAEPVRWAVDDPLESLLNASLLLDAEPPPAPAGSLAVQRVDAAALAADEALLRATFGLLIHAHYQTRPSDLRQLLDNPDIELWLARGAPGLAGVLLCTREGGLDPAMAARILDGRRRPRGHLLAQSLAVHAGIDQALGLRLLRVQRIAVQPALRRQGIGSQLLRQATDWARREGFDALGSVYGLDPGLLAFWEAAGFRPLRLGVRVDPASGAHSLFMLRGLSDAGQDMAGGGCAEFRRELPWSLGASLQLLDPELAIGLLRGRACDDLPIDDRARRALQRIGNRARRPETAEALIWRALVWLCAGARAPQTELAPLVARWLQHRSVSEVCRRYDLAGRRALECRLAGLLQHWEEHAPRSG